MPANLKKGKKSFGSVRAKAGLSAKAGFRKLPASKGPHITIQEARNRGRWLNSLGLTT